MNRIEEISPGLRPDPDPTPNVSVCDPERRSRKMNVLGFYEKGGASGISLVLMWLVQTLDTSVRSSNSLSAWAAPRVQRKFGAQRRIAQRRLCRSRALESPKNGGGLSRRNPKRKTRFRRLSFFVRHFQPVRKPHCHQPRLTAAPMKHSGQPIPEPFSIPHRLGHCCGNVQTFHSFALNVDAGEAGYVRLLPI